MVETVLVPLDGSSIGEGALPTAAWLARTLGAELHLISTTLGPETLDQQAYLQGVREGLGIDGVVPHIVGHRWPAPGIVDTLRSLPDPLLCMTTRGASGWMASVLGTVTDEVLRTTSDPVVLIGPRCAPEPAPRPGPVVVSVDGSEESFAVVPTVADLATGDRPVEVVTAAQTGRRIAGDARAELAEALLADAVTRLRAVGVEAAPQLLLGASPAELLVSLADERQAALVAIGTHGRSGLSARALGHVASEIVQTCPCPVLVRRVPG